MEELNPDGQNFIEPPVDPEAVDPERPAGVVPQPEDRTDGPNNIVESLVPAIGDLLDVAREGEEDQQSAKNRIMIPLLMFGTLGDIQDLSGILQVNLVPDNSTAETLIAKNEVAILCMGIAKFSGLGPEVARALIEHGPGWAVAEHLDMFSGVDHSTIAKALIDQDQGDAVARNLDKFSGLDHSTIAKALIEHGEGRALVEYLDKLSGVDHSTIAKALIEHGEGRAVARNLDKFSGVDHSTIAKALIEHGQGWVVARNLD